MNEPPLDEVTRIARVAFTLHAIYLQFREATWHSYVLDVQDQGNQIVIVQDGDMIERFNGWFATFPDHLVHDALEKAAILTTTVSVEIGYITKVLKEMLEGMDVLVEEVIVRLKPSPRRTVIVYPDTSVDLNDYDCWLFRITSRATGRQWALDIAGAQHDIRFPGFTWDLMHKFKIARIHGVKPLGTLQAYLQAVAQTKGTEGMEKAIELGAIQVFHETVGPAMEKKQLTWAAILHKGDNGYVRHRDKVLRVGRRAMEEYVINKHLNKRRLKAERYDRRHRDELLAETEKLCKEILEPKMIQHEPPSDTMKNEAAEVDEAEVD